MEYSGATGKLEAICKHCRRCIARTSNPRAVEWFHLDRADVDCDGAECSRDSETVAEPLIDTNEAIFATVERSMKAHRIRRAIHAGLKVSPEFAALAAGKDDAALIEAAKTEGAK